MMSLPTIHIKAVEVQRYGCNVLKICSSYYADIDDIAEAMHVPPELVYGALSSFQDKRSVELSASKDGE